MVGAVASTSRRRLLDSPGVGQLPQCAVPSCSSHAAPADPEPKRRREHEGRAPQVAGIDAAELESSGSAALRGAGRTPETDMGPAGKALLQEGAREEEVALALAAVNDDGEGVPGLWGQREDKQVQVRCFQHMGCVWCWCIAYSSRQSAAV